AIYGFERNLVARTASLMLTGPVSIVDADQVDLHNRIRFIEAVTSLLPYGVRASLAATTWAEARAHGTMRLAFADQLSSDSLEGENPSSIIRLAAGLTSAVTGHGGEYLRWLA
ncbi:MAG TPA: hypothetical protein VHZ03_16185, partial [Trebonia sp.]|nr:hypothetical protein [Trebonia sp.]